MPFDITIINHPNTYITHPELIESLTHLTIPQCKIKLLDYPDTSNMSFNLGYLDCSFEHTLIEDYLSLYQKRIDSLRKSNKTIYFKLRLLLSNQDYEYYKSQHTNNLSFKHYVLESLGYPCVDYVQIIRIEDLKEIRNQISRYAMSYFYYLNHGRI
ncbi:MAG: hypothetical protein HGA35_06390 [Erysipelotrichaceae bacterium]|nr:hypothetical protein [Erysipelotrichaceae bacterium]